MGYPGALDLRVIEPDLAELLFEARASSVERGESFWFLDDHDPVELIPVMEKLGFTVQSFVYSATEFRVFAGRL